MKNGLLVLCLLLFAWLAGPMVSVHGAAEPAVEAKEILKSTAFKGGLIVHLQCGGGELTAALRASENVLVHGLDADSIQVKKARAHIRSLGLYGAVSVAKLSGERLPYAENIVNLIVSKNLGRISMKEVMRVLTPRGVAYIKNGAKWTKTVKPVPENIDDWTHFLHGPDNNAVAKDTVVGAPKHIQWLGDPKWSRNHKAPSISLVVSAGGRLFSVVDEGAPLEAKPSGKRVTKDVPPSIWTLVARDAFNGIVLWKKSFGRWLHPNMGFKNSLLRYQRRMVASEDILYLTMGLSAPITSVDTLTGKTLRTYEGTSYADEFILAGDLLLVFARKVSTDITKNMSLRKAPDVLRAIHKDSGEVVWEKDISSPLLGTLSARDGRVFYSDDGGLWALNIKTGEREWRVDPLANLSKDKSSPGITFVVWKGVVLYANGKELISRSASAGDVLWKVPCPASYKNPADVFVVGGLVWAEEDGSSYNSTSFSVGRDPLTGEIKKKISSKEVWLQGDMGHHRCYRNKATDRFVLVGQTGTGFLNLETGENKRHDWVRGTCGLGMLPCNGLLYAPSHGCACYIEGKLNGFWALAAEAKSANDKTAPQSGPRLEVAPGQEDSAKRVIPEPHVEDWPTFRHDAARSGAASTAVSATALKPIWKTKVKGILSTMVCANGRIFVADTEGHEVHALGAAKGDRLWSFSVGGKVDSPPSIAQGRAVFGARDGWVYCVDAEKGTLMWRFRGAPEERNVIVKGRLESAWPIHGSVLIIKDTVYFAAGRSSYLDGGIFLYRLNLKTGEKISETCIYAPDEVTGKEPTPFRLVPEMPKTLHPAKVALSDILSSDGKAMYMRHTRFDYNGGLMEGIATHLFCSAGFLNKRWFHRAYWTYSDNFGSGATEWERPGSYSPSGRLLVMNDSSVFGFGRSSFREANKILNYKLFSSVKKKEILKEGLVNDRFRIRGNLDKKGEYRTFQWAHAVPISVRAMALAKTTLFAAGEVGDILLSQSAREGKNGALMWAVDAATGKKLAEYSLDAPPVFDGLIAARGKIYIALKDGSIVCMGE